MLERRQPVLTDASLAPDASRVSETLGTAFAAWQRLDTALTEPALGLELSWRYYRDGGWLRKAVRGRKTVAWLAAWEGYATITFYFSARHRAGLVALPLPATLRDHAAEVEMSGALLPLVIEIRTPVDVDAALEVLRFKLASR